MKNIYGILCALFIGIVQAQQPPVAPTLAAPAAFYFNKPVPSAQMLAAAQVAKELRQAREAVAQASPKKWPRVHAQLKGILKAAEKKLASADKVTLHLIDFMGRYKTPEERIDAAIRANDRELLKFVIADARAKDKKVEPFNEQAFDNVATEAIRYHKKPADSDDTLTLVEELLIRAHNIPQDIRDFLLSAANQWGKPDLIPLLLYGGVITIGNEQYPVEGGARGGFFVDIWPAGSLHKIIATGNLEGKNAADLDYLQHKTLNLRKRNVWWKDLEEDTLRAVQKALDAGADVNQLDSNGRSPLHVAARYSTPAIVELLLARGAKIDAQDNYGETPLHWAAEGGQTDTVGLLFDRGAKIDAQDNYVETPLHLAAKYGQTKTVRVLLDRGAKIDAQDNSGTTPLHYAAANGQADIVRLLLEKGAQIDAKEVVDATPLHLAAQNGHSDAVRILLDWGAQIDSRDVFGRTALHYAAEFGWTDTVRVLLEMGANPSILDNEEKNALDYSKKDEIKKLIEDGMKKYKKAEK